MLKACFLRYRRGGLLLCLMLFGMLAASAVNAQQTDVFGRTASGAPSAANTAEASAASPPSVDTETHRFVPDSVRKAIGWSIQTQSRLNEHLQDVLGNAGRDFGTLAAWTIVLLSFAYGILHALGPGHGKIVISAYLASHRARVADAVVLSAWSAFVQALSAIILVGGAAWLSRAGLSGVLTRASSLELSSYIVLLGVGAWSLWSVVTRRHCCTVGRVELVPRKRFARLSNRKQDSVESSYLGRRLRSQHAGAAWQPDEGTGRPRGTGRQIFLTGIAIGIRPCVGAIFVLIAALANHIFMIGVLSALAMSVGVSCTVLVIGAGSLTLNRMLSNGSAARAQRVERWRFVLSLSGAIFISLYALWNVVSLMASWQAFSLT